MVQTRVRVVSNCGVVRGEFLIKTNNKVVIESDDYEIKKSVIKEEMGLTLKEKNVLNPLSTAVVP